MQVTKYSDLDKISAKYNNEIEVIKSEIKVQQTKLVKIGPQIFVFADYLVIIFSSTLRWMGLVLRTHRCLPLR